MKNFVMKYKKKFQYFVLAVFLILWVILVYLIYEYLPLRFGLWR